MYSEKVTISQSASLSSSSHQSGGSGSWSRRLITLMATILILSVCIESTQAFVAGSRPLSKRSFFDIQCKGVYDKAIFGRLDRICDDCYNLYREPQLHALCSQNCFSTKTFLGCLDALLLGDEWPVYRDMITTLHAADTSNSLAE